MMVKRGKTVVDNSMSDLVLDLWGDDLAAYDDRQEKTEGVETVEASDELLAPEAPSDASALEATPAVRLAWSAAYSIRAALVTVAVFVVSAVALTMVINPDMTLLDAINMYIDKIGGFVAGIGK